MAKWVHADVLDNGIAYIKANCNKMALVSAYSAGDSYATVNAAIVADAAMASGDFTIAASGSNRTLTTAAAGNLRQVPCAKRFLWPHLDCFLRPHLG